MSDLLDSRIAVMNMVIRVEKDARPARTDALEAAAIAAVKGWWRSLDLPVDLQESWVSEPRKLIRRARGSSWLRVCGEAPVVTQIRSAEVACFAVAWGSEIPVYLSRLPVSGTELVDEYLPPEPRTSVPVIWLNPFLGMTAGKAMAQAGHGAISYWNSLEPEARSTWTQCGMPMLVRTAPRERWAALSRSSQVICDAGHTEVAAGSLTAVVTDEL